MDIGTYDLFSRQIPFLGKANQQKLSEAKVVVVGGGGLGSFASEMLVRMGVGVVRIIDRDLVEESNLHRTLFSRKSIGKPKALALEERLKTINPSSRVQGVIENLTDYNAAKMFTGFDAVVDCSDNMETRYSINKTCVEKGMPWVYGSALRDEGFSSAFATSGKPCFMCLYPRKPGAGQLPLCNVEGVVSPIIGMISSWEVMEAVKILTGMAKPNYSRLFRVSLGLASGEPKFELLGFRRKEDCGTCGEWRKRPWKGK